MFVVQAVMRRFSEREKTGPVECSEGLAAAARSAWSPGAQAATAGAAGAPPRVRPAPAVLCAAGRPARFPLGGVSASSPGTSLC